jgi:hypothetical protein
MPWREIGLLDIAKNLPQRRRRRGDYEASTHSATRIAICSVPFNPRPATLKRMTSAARNRAKPDHQPDPDQAARAVRLRAANINPRTGLATDYLNHFNEAIMLLEMIPDMPECAEDFLNWHPLSYREHFMASNFKARDLAIEAYDSADAVIRAEFDNIASAMTSILTAVGNAMREARQDKTRATLAQQATGWVKPLVALAGGIINGGSEDDVDYIMTH